VEYRFRCNLELQLRRNYGTGAAAFGRSVQSGDRPVWAESDCKRLLLGDGTGQSAGTFCYASHPELPIMLLSGWPVPSPITGHCGALSANCGHSDNLLRLPIADIQEVNSPVPDARLDTLHHTKG
jgi:hypothetical protein